jgi:hypothetical protein
VHLGWGNRETGVDTEHGAVDREAEYEKGHHAFELVEESPDAVLGGQTPDQPADHQEQGEQAESGAEPGQKRGRRRARHAVRPLRIHGPDRDAEEETMADQPGEGGAHRAAP